MDVSAYFESISLELEALKNRVRNFIDDAHWQTDGEWKESVLRAVLKRHLPSTVGVGRGFALQNVQIPQEIRSSKQIDIILFDTSKPVLYRDGDLIFVPSMAVKGIIEVKTKINTISQLKEILSDIVYNAKIISDNNLQTTNPKKFVGLFSYDTDLKPKDKYKYREILQLLKAITVEDPHIIINHLSLGSTLFVKYWEHSPVDQNVKDYNTWHAYRLKERAQGYFINNVITFVSPDQIDLNQDLWFPPENRKENSLLGKLGLR